jgi:hypothetical protein
LKKLALFLLFACLLSNTTKAQLMVSKMIGKDASRFGLGYGLFTYFDIPVITDNQSIRIELMDLAFFPTKGENIFTSKTDSKGYISIKLGYKYVFSETNAGFYVIPSAGYCRTVFTKEGEDDATHGDGIAAALEGGYALAVGQNGHTVNFGLKYEYDHGNSTHIIQSVGVKVSYSFGLFRRKEDY